MKLQIKAGSTSQTIQVFIQDSSSTTGAGKTDLVYNTSGLTAYYALPRAAAQQISLATMTVTGAYSSGGFVAIDGTNMPGWYRFDLPDAALASGRFVGIHLQGAAGMAPLPIEIELTAWDNQQADIGITQGGADKVWSTTARTLTAAGLDSIVVETGVNARQALSVASAALAGILEGAGSGTIVIKGANVPSTTRITATTDGDGNRSAVTLSLPT